MLKSQIPLQAHSVLSFRLREPDRATPCALAVGLDDAQVVVDERPVAGECGCKGHVGQVGGVGPLVLPDVPAAGLR